MTRKGFTLIELLVVVSIISLLSSVVLASLNSARDKARLGAGKQFAANVYHASADSAIAIWPFNEGSGGTVLDASGNSNSGVLTNGPTWSTDVPAGTGSSVLFDGLNDYIQVSDAQILKWLGGDLTVSAWIKPNSTETSGADIISKPWNGSGNYNYQLVINTDSTISFGLSVATGYWLNSSKALPKGAWSYVVATVDGTTKAVKIYVDGALVASGAHSMSSYTVASGDGGTALCIGTLYPYGSGWGGNTGMAFDGYIDQPAIYNKALTAADIRTTYLAGLNAHVLAEK